MCNPGLLCSIGEAINAWMKDLNWIYAKVLNRNCRKDRCADKIYLLPADSISIPKNDVTTAYLERRSNSGSLHKNSPKL